MTLSDWLHPRMDGSLHWQQSLAITVVFTLIAGPGYLWWTYDAQPKAVASEAVAWTLGPASDFQPTRILNSLSLHEGVFTQPNGADTMICGTVLADGLREPIAVLAERRRRQGLHNIVVITPGRIETSRYPGAGPEALDWCAREIRAKSA